MDGPGSFGECDIGDAGEEGGVGNIGVESGDGDIDSEVHVGSIGMGDGPRSSSVEEVFELMMRDESLYR